MADNTDEMPNIGPVWAWAVGLGAAYALLKTLGFGGGGNKQPEPQKRHTIGPQQGAMWVRINSLNGEPLYEKKRSTGAFPDGWGDPTTQIARAANGTIVGMTTGGVYQPSDYYPQLIQIYGETADGVRFNAWVQADQTELVRPGNYAAEVAQPKAAARVSDTDLQTGVREYFNTRYPPTLFFTTA